MRRINNNIYPPGGYVFTESDGAKVFGDTWAGVIERVRRYRERAGLAPGNPGEEVIAQACARTPSLCHEVTGVEARARVIVSLKGRVLKWLTETRARKDNLIFVQTEEWKRRAAICSQCKENQPLPGGCATCKAAVAELRKTFLERRPLDGRLNACAMTGEDLPSAAHIELPAQENPNLPQGCWRRKVI